VSVVADGRRKRYENEKENRRRDKRAIVIIFTETKLALWILLYDMSQSFPEMAI
jgi:hypothetical protein